MEDPKVSKLDTSLDGPTAQPQDMDVKFTATFTLAAKPTTIGPFATFEALASAAKQQGAFCAPEPNFNQAGEVRRGDKSGLPIGFWNKN
jgi:hypothetical protein